MYRYAGKLDPKLFPQFLGRMIDKLHRLNHWRTKDGNELYGRLWYHDRIGLHLFCNPRTDSLNLVDFGNAELINQKEYDNSKIAREKITEWEIENVVKDLIGYAFPFGRAITSKNVSEYKDLLSEFADYYYKESGIEISLSSRLRWMLRSKS